MGDIISFLLDVVMAGLLITGIVYAMRLSRQLAALRASRGEMERFVAEFSATVQRAEAGVRGLKQAARDSGDDLEKLIGKAETIRDELAFLVESADQIANRLSDSAAGAARSMLRPESPASSAAAGAAPLPFAKSARPEPARAPVSAVERDLLRVLEKRG